MSRYVRYRSGLGAAWGLVAGDFVHELKGSPLDGAAETGTDRKLSELTLLCPCEPGKIVAVGRNYRSHLGARAHPQNPEIFYKPISSLQDPDGPIVIPPDATDVHYEGELVLVIGKRVKDASGKAALAAIFGATGGNDVSERQWQHGERKDIQWWRAKGSDTFSPVGPALVTGLNYDNLLVQTRLNGEIVQKESTADFIFDCATMISWISRWVTLLPGDLIFTGTPGTTRKMSPGDIVEVDIESIGVLRNPVA
ncbi:MAG TPA: fumarylacetoacetate hydrolase family protein [Bryobacteraceae bacterium]|nr:fumarylacetoacetate hydrolase family protein [Bryobacteraceae bacterium]